MQQVPEVAFTEDNDMIQAFPPDRADEAFTITVLPGLLPVPWTGT